MRVEPSAGPQAPSGAWTEHAAALLDRVRHGRAATRQELGLGLRLGRKALPPLVSALLDRGLLTDGGPGASTAARSRRELHFAPGAGALLVAQFGATGLSAAVADLEGRLTGRHHETHDIAAGPERALGRVEELFDRMLDARSAGAPAVWGIAVGLPGPVEFRSGRPIAPPIMPGWDGYPVRDRFAARYRAPAWVDNDANLMALGEARSGVARGQRDLVYVKIGTGIGAGVVSDGRLHRGANGSAGDVGHVRVGSDSPVLCQCGSHNCLEALAGGAALARDGTAAARDGSSPFLAARLREREAISGFVEARDVVDAAHAGDSAAIALLSRSGQLVGDMLATVVNFYNPTMIVIGGGVASAGDLVLAAVRRTVYERSLPLATRDLRILRSADSVDVGLIGAANMAADELFAAPTLARWLPHGSPVDQPELTEANATDERCPAVRPRRT